MTDSTAYDEVVFGSGGDDVHGWHFAGAGDTLDGGRGRPVVVMAHGLGGTKDSGLEPFAVGLAKAGLDVLAFDYRGFGDSAGEPRQRVDLDAQVEDYRAAMAAAASLPGVDRGRIVLWGVSLAGGHVLVCRSAPGRRRGRDLADAAGRRPGGRPAGAQAPRAVQHREVDGRRLPRAGSRPWPAGSR